VKKDLERRVSRIEGRSQHHDRIDLSHLSIDDLQFLSRLPFNGQQVDVDRLTPADRAPILAGLRDLAWRCLDLGSGAR
jgi:hypothetical protein